LTSSYFTRVLRLTYLAPDITRAILEGRHPRDLTARKLLAHSRLPLTWPEQRRISGSPDPAGPGSHRGRSSVRCRFFHEQDAVARQAGAHDLTAN
jgi:hypothetical protein